MISNSLAGRSINMRPSYRYYKTKVSERLQGGVRKSRKKPLNSSLLEYGLCHFSTQCPPNSHADWPACQYLSSVSFHSNLLADELKWVQYLCELSFNTVAKKLAYQNSLHLHSFQYQFSSYHFLPHQSQFPQWPSHSCNILDCYW